MSRCTAAIASLLALTTILPAADLSTYRGLRLGTDLASAVRSVAGNIADVRAVHSRPALIQEFEWRPGYEVRHDTANPDPVREHVLRFVNGRLFEIISTYDREKVEGMRPADLIEIISRTYGTASSPGGEIPYRSNFGDVATVLARWEDADHSANLVRSADGVTYALVLTSKRLDQTARAAVAEARQLDEIEAPGKAIEHRRNQEAAERLTLDKSRATNKPNFRP